jgi:hypothetical protein
MTRIIPILLLLTAALLSGCSSMDSMMGGQSSALLKQLTSQLGVTDTQAAGGVGGMLKLAQEKLSAGDFDQVAKAIPGADKYLATAKQFLGGTNVGSAAGLQGIFSKLGMSPDMVDKFKPIVSDYVSKNGGEKAGSLFAGALK